MHSKLVPSLVFLKRRPEGKLLPSINQKKTRSKYERVRTLDRADIKWLAAIACNHDGFKTHQNHLVNQSMAPRL